MKRYRVVSRHIVKLNIGFPPGMTKERAIERASELVRDWQRQEAVIVETNLEEYDDGEPEPVIAETKPTEMKVDAAS